MLGNIKRPPLLSILIPTYNRAECLDFNLNILLKQVGECYANKIEIIVSNNFSSDHTKSVLKKYSDKNYPFFTTLNNSENIGADRNFLKLLRSSHGEFVWIFGDDEVLYDGALPKISLILQSHPQLGLLHMPQFGHKRLQDFDPSFQHKNPKTEIFENSSLFLEKVSQNLSFITSNIFKRSYVDEVQIAPEKFVNSCLIQQIFYLQAALKAPENIFFEDRIFSQLSNNTGGYKVFEVFAVNQQRIFDFFLDFGLQKKTVRKINNDLIKTFFPVIILLVTGKGKKSKFEDEPIFKILYRKFKGYPNFWIYCVPLLMLPYNVRDFLISCVRQLKHFKKNRASSYGEKFNV